MQSRKRKSDSSVAISKTPQRAPRVFKAQFSVNAPTPMRIERLQGEDWGLAYLRTLYEQHGFNMAALQALIVCEKQNLPVPRWLRKFLAKGARRHIDPKLRVSLDQSIGLVSGSGQRRGDRAMHHWLNRTMLVSIVHQLRRETDPGTGNPFRVMDACKKLTRGRKDISAASLAVLYRKRKHEFEDSD